MEKRPTKAEELFLSLAYNRFYDLFEEVMEDGFWEKELVSLCKVSHAYAVYADMVYELSIGTGTRKKRRPTDAQMAVLCLNSFVIYWFIFPFSQLGMMYCSARNSSIGRKKG